VFNKIPYRSKPPAPGWIPQRTLALKIALGYALLGSIWILLSGQLLHRWVQDPAWAATLENVKGWFFIAVTALLLGLALGRYFYVIRRSAELLQENERLLQTVMDLVPHFIFAKDRHSRHLLANKACAAANGRTCEQMIGLCDFDLVSDRAQAEMFMRDDREVMDGGKPKLRAEETLTDASGRTRILRTIKVPFVIPGGGGPGLVGVAVDITDLKRAQAALEESEARYRLLAENSSDVIWLFDLASNRFTYVSPSVERLRGFTVAEVLQQTLEEALTPESHRVVAEGMAGRLAAFAAGDDSVRTQMHEVFQSCKDGRTVATEVVTTLIADSQRRVTSIQGVTRNITERKRAENALRLSLDEKTALLKEVHHRVKNNLQIVSSLLSLQAGKDQSPATREALRDTQDRVRSMALLHETLYRSGNLARLELPAYIESLCTQLLRSCQRDSSQITLLQNVADVHLELDQAVPCGLIVSELVANALKHAFPNGRAGQIQVEIAWDRSDQLKLEVADNGVGLPADLDLAQVQSLGLLLVHRLAGQLGGTAVFERHGGTTWQIRFPVSVAARENP
jgi:PAS domain S-box-containing protein